MSRSEVESMLLRAMKSMEARIASKGPLGRVQKWRPEAKHPQLEALPEGEAWEADEPSGNGAAGQADAGGGQEGVVQRASRRLSEVRQKVLGGPIERSRSA
jgi:hypothetical protein